MHTLLCLVVVCAHPIEEHVYDRTISVRLTANAVVVEYVLEVSDLTAFNDAADLVSDEERPTITSREASPSLSQRHRASARQDVSRGDRQETSLLCLQGKEVAGVGSSALRIPLRGTVAAGAQGTAPLHLPRSELRGKEGNDPALSRNGAAVKLLARTQPDEALLKCKSLDLRPGDEERRAPPRRSSS